jgi:hypothetical protein
MLASINPLGERARNQSYPVTVAAYVAASTAAAALLGAALGALGNNVATTAVAIVAVVLTAVIGLILDSRLGHALPLGPRRQVNEDWLATYRGWVYGAGFGAQLGSGFSTIVVASATWVAFACALFAGSTVGGLLVGATFGLARALPVLLTASAHDGASLSRTFRRLDVARPRVAWLTTGVQVLAAASLLAWGVATVG